jgi:2',3'-cyclic-nucleotide 2'-phosphodiesterase (5'-nucleotidase family)
MRRPGALLPRPCGAGAAACRLRILTGPKPHCHCPASSTRYTAALSRRPVTCWNVSRRGGRYSQPFLALAACHAIRPPDTPPPGTNAHLALLETTDIHTNVLSYDYFRLSEDPTSASNGRRLIRAARKEFENSLTFDAGDTIQGTALADWQAQVKPLACDSELAIYKAMDEIGYDAGTIGNHEFNYGLPF